MTNTANAMRLVSDETDRAAADEGQMLKTLITRNMNQGGNIMLLGLEPLPDAEFYAGQANGISAAWTLGHLACVLDLFTSWIENRDLAIPRWSHDIFNPLTIEKRKGTKAEGVDPKALAKGDIMMMFRQAQIAAVEVLRGFDMRLWDAPTPPNVPDNVPTYGGIWQMLSVHTYWHLGELCGCMPRFHGTYTLNMAAHYFYTSAIQRSVVVPTTETP
jgi:hypothetical protein